MLAICTKQRPLRVGIYVRRAGSKLGRSAAAFNALSSIYVGSHHAGTYSKTRVEPMRMKDLISNEINLLFSKPKGFGKYSPNSNSDDTATNKDNTGDKSNEKYQGSSNSNRSKKPSAAEKLAAIFFVALFLRYVLQNFDEDIDWLQFLTYLLESGEVESITISNNRVARIALRNPVSIPRRSINSTQENNADISENFDDRNSTDTDPWSTQFEKFENDREAVASAKNRKKSFPRKYYQMVIGSVDSFEKKLEDAQSSIGINSRDFIPVMYKDEAKTAEIISSLVPLILLGATVFFMSAMSGSSSSARGGIGNIFNVGRSTAKLFKKEDVSITFKDVAGVDQAKKEIMEFVEFLKNPKKFTDLGAKIPKGAMLSGPPGTGKTLLAKATAGEANVPFFTISGSEFIEMYAGIGASRVRDLFKEARANAPCIVFIDEIDAVGRKRGTGRSVGSNDERESTLNQLLVEMDGFNERTNIVMLAGTNRIDVLDKALLRPGRFDRQIHVELPDIVGRKQIFKLYLSRLKLEGTIDFFSGRLAGLTPGFSGADIRNICNEAAIVAARKDRKTIDLRCFEEATDRVIGGLESKKLISPEEKRIVAYHEAGHAVAGWNLEHADPLLKVTIVPRGKGALGYAQYLPKEVFLRNQAQITDMICMALAGRASEQVNFGSYTTGASDDLKRVTQIVYQMIGVYGMSDKVGQLAYPPEEGTFGRQYSNRTAKIMDEEARRLVDAAYKRTVELITKYKDQVRVVAELLLEKETINHDDVLSLIGPRPFASSKAYEDFIASKMSEDSDEAPFDQQEEQLSRVGEDTGDEPKSEPNLSPA